MEVKWPRGLLQSGHPTAAKDESVLSKARILAQSGTSLLDRLGPARVAFAVALMGFGIVAAFGFAPESGLPADPPQLIARDLQRPLLAALSSEGGYWREERIQRGDTLGSVLSRLGVQDPAAELFLRSDSRARTLYQLRPGKPVRVKFDDDGHLVALRYLAQGGELLDVSRDSDAFVAQLAAPTADLRLELRAGEIRSSLFAASDAIGLPDAITIQLADIFSGDIDFYHDLRRGDRFTVVYEMRELDGTAIGAGRILAAEFVNKGITFRAFLWHARDGGEAYYAEDGKSLRKAFMRSPVEFTRITSGFSLARFHPFLQTWRAHKGVDFAAPTGTPVRASGDGRVAFAGSQNGYGNVVSLQHSGAYSTLYAHLSRFGAGVRPGVHVAQGDIIGYVGQTGWATGPHLHYEFRVNNEQRDPLTIALPDALPVSAAERVSYLERVVPLAAELALSRGLILAGAE
ncbi:MAG: M23 family peptidase [Betaproteobacteria bacterium]|nr:MAG: M23 family peptidase [Betaproteobacteria bacterium]